MHWNGEHYLSSTHTLEWGTLFEQCYALERGALFEQCSCIGTGSTIHSVLALKEVEVYRVDKCWADEP